MKKDVHKVNPLIESLVHQLVDQKFEQFRQEWDSKTEGVLRELRSQLTDKLEVHKQYSQELSDRVGQLEARLEKLHDLMMDGFFVPKLTPNPKATNVMEFSPRGSPQCVETVIDDYHKFQTVEPPEMESTPRGFRQGPCDEPKVLKPLLGPQWGFDEQEELEQSDLWGRSPRRWKRTTPWDRPPDEGSVGQKDAAWLWQVNVERRHGGKNKLGIELHYQKDTDQLVITHVKDGLVSDFNAENASRRVEVGDVIVGVGHAVGNAEVMLQQLGIADSLKIKRDMANWQRIRAAKMGYVEAIGKLRIPGPTY